MKATEIMIGDWVMFTDPTDGCKYPVRLKSINANSCCGIEGKSLLSLADDFEPIPITPEILEKNGFEHDVFENHDRYRWKQLNDSWLRGDLIAVHFNKQITANIYSSNAIGTIIEFTPNHVHELQHALRICNIEKDIEL